MTKKKPAKNHPRRSPFDYLPAEKHLPATREMMRVSRDELKSEVLALHRKTDSIDHRITGLHSRIDAVGADVREAKETLGARIDEVNTSLSAKIDHVNTTLSARIEEANTSLSAKIDHVNTTLSARIEEVNTTLNAKIDGVEARLTARIDQVEERLSAQMYELKSLFLELFTKMDARMTRLEAAVHEMGLRIESQESNNRIVLEGLTGLAQRQDRLEKRMDGVEDTVRSIAKYRPKDN